MSEELIGLGANQTGCAYNASGKAANWVEVPPAWLRAAGWVPASEVEALRQAWQPVRDAWADLMTSFAGEHPRTDAELAAWAVDLYKACRTIDTCQGMPKVESDDGQEYAMWAQVVVGCPLLSIG